jgi:RNA ligase
MAEPKVFLSHLFDTAELAELIEAGYVRQQVHPKGSLTILNYTEKAQYERVWNDVTRQCRGLIVRDGSEVVARPFTKFFNYGEHPEGSLDLNARAVVTDKMDGSLGILYPSPEGGYAVATRGSFTSEQAIHATKIWWERYADTTEVDEGITWLFEIIYPANRIVCDYGDMDDLVLLGGVDILTGRPIRPGFFVYDGPKTKTFDFDTLGEALAAEPRNGAEGYVIRFPDHDHLMIKIKQDDYVALHRIVTGLNARVVWEQLGDGKDTAAICEPLPDELHDWVKQVASDLCGQLEEIQVAAEDEHDRIERSLPEGWTRKDYAAVAAKSPNRAWLFMLLDGRDPVDKIWRTLRPSGDNRPLNITEDVA